MFAGVLFDADGEAMTPTHAVKKGVRYRRYVSRRLITGVRKGARSDSDQRETGQRVPAADLERLTINRLKAFFADPDAVTDALAPHDRSAPNVKRALGAAADIVKLIASEDAAAKIALLRSLIVRAQVHSDRIGIELSAERIRGALLGGNGSTASHVEPRHDADLDADKVLDDDRRIPLAIDAKLQRAGVEMRFVVDGATGGAAPNDGLVRLLMRAHALARRLADRPSATLEEAAGAKNVGAPYAARLMRLNFLAPDIVVAILNGGQPETLTATTLMADTRLPLAWSKQRDALGFA